MEENVVLLFDIVPHEILMLVVYLFRPLNMLLHLLISHASESTSKFSYLGGMDFAGEGVDLEDLFDRQSFRLTWLSGQHLRSV